MSCSIDAQLLNLFSGFNSNQNPNLNPLAALQQFGNLANGAQSFANLFNQPFNPLTTLQSLSVIYLNLYKFLLESLLIFENCFLTIRKFNQDLFFMPFKTNPLVTWGLQNFSNILRINGRTFVRDIQLRRSEMTENGNRLTAVVEVAIVDDQNRATVNINGFWYY